jgi:diguanylate cyclase (GGDEF)-like protein/PAS domain S-box-containing protein
MATLKVITHWCNRSSSRSLGALARRGPRTTARSGCGEETQAESERSFRALLEIAPDAIVIVDCAGQIRLINRQAEQLFGWQRCELIGRSVAELIPEHLRARHEAHFKAYLRDQRTRPMGGGLELLARRRDGSQLPVEISLGTLHTPDGLLICSVIRDISERRRVQEARRAAEELFRTAFEAAPVGMALAGLDGRIANVNQALCELVGCPAGELEGRQLTAILHADASAGGTETLASPLCGEPPGGRAERRYAHRDGHLIPVDVRVAVVHDGEGNASRLLALVSDISEQQRFEAELLYLADHDPLTGMFNRRRFEQELKRELARLARRGGEGALLAIDLDHFKSVNDTLGHGAGDELLAAVAGALRERLRATDTLARLGGDEFAAILVGCGREQALSVARSLLAAVRDLRPPGDRGGRARVTASIGIALMDGRSADGAEKLAEADMAMYDAKESGRDCVLVYQPSGERPQRMHWRSSWAQRIATALRSGGLMLYAQPIVALAGDALARYELLVRMADRDGAAIPPQSFLHVAESCELIAGIDSWVLEQAVALLAQRRHAGQPVHLSVNLSANSIVDPTLPQRLAALLARRRIDGQGLCVEVAEAAAIVNIAHVPGLARELAALGCELAIDDFGAGFASFSYLKHLEFDYLKIDGEFIRRLTNSQVNQSVVRAVVEIARNLGKRTVAESVEDGASLALLRRLGVDFAQGFHLAAPRPLTAGGLPARPNAG